MIRLTDLDIELLAIIQALTGIHLGVDQPHGS
jgi:hypothetical protein